MLRVRSLVLLMCVLASTGCSAARTSRLAAIDGSACAADSGRTSAGIYYECTGAGPTVILIHGFSVDRRMWDAQVEALRGSYRVITYDLRAHGRTPAAPSAYMATDDLLGLMNELPVPRASLVGLSNGARIALDFGLLYPSRVQALVLAAGGASGYVGTDPMTWMAPVATAARAGDLERAAELWAATPLMHIPDDSAAAARVRALTRDNRALWGIRANPERPLEPPAIKRLAEVRVRTLVMSGELDLPDLRRLADTVARGIPGARLHIVRGAGHMLNLAKPVEFNRVMLDFLREQ